MDNYRKMDLDGRAIWNATTSGKCQIEYTEAQFDRADGYMTGSTGTRSVFEIKRRNQTASQYEKEGYYLQEDKYQELKARKEDKGYDQALYINIFDDFVYVWRIDNVKPKFEKRRMTRSTAEHYRDEIVWKSVALLKKDDTIWKTKR